MWDRLFDAMLRAMVREGRLSVEMPDGTRREYGDEHVEPVRVRLSDPALPRKILMSRDLAVGEAYMDGTLTIEGDDIRGFLALVARNVGAKHGAAWQAPVQFVRNATRRLRQFNPAPRARRNVAHHYDLSAKLYDLFLDADKQYSCAYFRDPGMSLEDAQAAKKAHIAEKLLIRPGMRVLDIGCGWGGMGLTLARDYGARVVGVTLSQEQHKIATRRAAEAGLSGQVDFRLMDYRHVSERFDRIVSVGMFEHVGVPHYREYFRTVRNLLAEDGVALIHTIGRSDPPGASAAWLDRYIFPGGYTPAMSEAMAAVEKERLVSTDIEMWRLHYAETLKHWFDRFSARMDAAEAIYDARFVRMWRFYLAASEMGFRHNGQVVFQFQLARDQAAVPLTRDYLYHDVAPAQMHHAAE